MMIEDKEPFTGKRADTMETPSITVIIVSFGDWFPVALYLASAYLLFLTLNLFGKEG